MMLCVTYLPDWPRLTGWTADIVFKEPVAGRYIFSVEAVDMDRASNEDTAFHVLLNLDGQHQEYVGHQLQEDETLEAFVKQSVANKTPFLAALWLHYIHLPHPAMPKYYAQYANDPDYVGTLQQLDDNIGAIVDMLKKHAVWEDTLFFFTRSAVGILLLIQSHSASSVH